jgi:hypothetical protein
MSLSPCLFHIVCCICCSFLYICINIFSNVIYNFCLHVVLTKSHLISLFFVTWSPLYILSIKAYLISRPPLETPDERSSLEKSKFSLYFSGSCIPTNESLFFFRPPSLRHIYRCIYGDGFIPCQYIVETSMLVVVQIARASGTRKIK